MPDPRDAPWLRVPPRVERYDRFWVAREDLVPGGAKNRFLPHLIAGAPEIVFGGPYCGGAPYALAVLGGYSGQRVTLFYAARARARWHPRQVGAARLGAVIQEVRPGYMTVVQARARAYAQAAGALFLPLGFDVPAAVDPFLAVLAAVRARLGDPPEVWCATGSGMLARCLGVAFPASAVHAVTVGLASRHDAQPFTSNVTLHPTRYDFAQVCPTPAPFPSCGHYERKAWEQMVRRAAPGSLFWNVAA
jgi:hypothetical protein